MITQKILKELFDYNPETGAFTWRVARSNRIQIGDPVGSSDGKGYRQIRLGSWKGRTHQLIWFWWYGDWATGHIDHEDRVKSNNRIKNLRDLTVAQNAHNAGLHPRNTSGYPGVSWAAHRNKWAAHICANKKRHHLGLFSTKEEAARAYQAAKKILHPTTPKQPASKAPAGAKK
jgi:hypothetical protein